MKQDTMCIINRKAIMRIDDGSKNVGEGDSPC